MPDPSVMDHDLGIQQIRAEILEFVSVLLAKKLRGNVLEIGLGKYGGTHMLWRQLFDKVVTIDLNPTLIENFRKREQLDARSLLIAGSSFDIYVRDKVRRILGEVDLLFIDGDHEYESVLRDWDAYHHLVRPGGLIAFHDSLCTQPKHGVDAFLKNLASGMFGKSYPTHTIAHSRQIGISYVEI